MAGAGELPLAGASRDYVGSRPCSVGDGSVGTDVGAPASGVVDGACACTADPEFFRGVLQSGVGGFGGLGGGVVEEWLEALLAEYRPDEINEPYPWIENQILSCCELLCGTGTESGYALASEQFRRAKERKEQGKRNLASNLAIILDLSPYVFTFFWFAGR